ncbi:MAG: 2-C-methyl-D-erythritol 4-phosphate cytidylyltransferase [Erysipelotrichaceae bacterium]
MKYSVIVLAAGSGTRANLGYNKLLYVQDGKTIIEQTLQLFMGDERCKQILVTYAPSDDALIQLMQTYPVELVQGGQTRAHSVNNALQRVNQPYVLIHDGARPYLAMSDLDALLDAMKLHDAAILGVPVKDTIKVVDQGMIRHTPPRATLWHAQTPQAFKTSLLVPAYQKALDQGRDLTDDASVLEENVGVFMVKGSYENSKVTTPDDFRR